MKILFLINDAPYGTEKVYNALRLAMTLQKEHKEVEPLIFFIADSVTSALQINKLQRVIIISNECLKV